MLLGLFWRVFIYFFLSAVLNPLEVQKSLHVIEIQSNSLLKMWTVKFILLNSQLYKKITLNFSLSCIGQNMQEYIYFL